MVDGAADGRGAEHVRRRLAEAREVIAGALEGTGRSPDEVRIMAVTKTHPASVVLTALKAGVRLIGENRVSEGGRKIREVGSGRAEFHMIGPLHRGEVRQAVRDFAWLDAVCRRKIVDEVARRTVAREREQPGILFEVNTSGEESKMGWPPEAALLEEELGHAASLGLTVSGLLTIGPLGGGESATRRAFAMLRRLRDDLSRSTGMELPELSMGMSDDFAAAAAEGATTVRLGRYLLGPRNRRGSV